MTQRPEDESSDHSQQDPEEQEEDDLPWVMVSGEEWEDLVHPEEVIVVPFNEKGEECPEKAERVVVFREEDYHEPDDEGCVYSGLVELVPDEEDPEYLTVPDSFACPACSGEAFMEKDISNADGFFYYCRDCGAPLVLETRSYLRNAAVLWMVKV